MNIGSRQRSARGIEETDDASIPTRQLLSGATSFSLFGEICIVGLIVALLSFPVVTAVPAMAAGSLHLRRHLSGESDSLVRFLKAFGRAARDLWGLGLLTPGVVFVTSYNVWLAANADLAGRVFVGVVNAVIGGTVIIVTLRTAATWSPGTGGVHAIRAAAKRVRQDLSGSALLLAAVALCAMIVWMLEPLVLLVGGLLAMAAVAVEQRRSQT